MQNKINTKSIKDLSAEETTVIRCPNIGCNTPAFTGFLAPGSELKVKCRRCKTFYKVTALG